MAEPFWDVAITTRAKVDLVGLVRLNEARFCAFPKVELWFLTHQPIVAEIPLFSSGSIMPISRILFATPFRHVSGGSPPLSAREKIPTL